MNVSELVGALSDVLCVKANSTEETGQLMVMQALDAPEKGHYLSCGDSPWDTTAKEDHVDHLEVVTEQKVNKTIHEVLHDTSQLCAVWYVLVCGTVK